MRDCTSVCASPHWPRLSRKSPRPEPPPDEPEAEHAGSLLCWGNEFRIFAERTFYWRGDGNQLELTESWNWVGSSCFFLKKPTDVSQAHEPCDLWEDWQRVAHLPAPTSFIPTICLSSRHLYCNSQDWLLSSPSMPTYRPLFCVCVYILLPSLAAYSFWAVSAFGSIY